MTLERHYLGSSFQSAAAHSLIWHHPKLNAEKYIGQQRLAKKFPLGVPSSACLVARLGDRVDALDMSWLLIQAGFGIKLGLVKVRHRSA